MQSDVMHQTAILRLVCLNPHSQLHPFVDELCHHDNDAVRYAAMIARAYFGAQQRVEILNKISPQPHDMNVF